MYGAYVCHTLYLTIFFDSLSLIFFCIHFPVVVARVGGGGKLGKPAHWGDRKYATELVHRAHCTGVTLDRYSNEVRCLTPREKNTSGENC